MNLEIKSINELLKLIEDKSFHIRPLSNFGLWFRGQPDFEDKLIPKIFRQGPDYGNVGYSEMSMVKSFQLRFPDQNIQHKSIFEWLTLMQHYGLPTRLLDWTQNILIGLYFTVNKHTDEKDGALFIIDPTSLNTAAADSSGLFHSEHDQVIFRSNLCMSRWLKHFLKLPEITNLIESSGVEVKIMNDKLVNDKYDKAIRTPIAVTPPILNNRILVQQGTCTLHGGMIYCERVEVNPINIEELEGVSLLKIKVSKNYKTNILNQLKICGIHEASLFPEMEHQASFITESWTSKLKESTI